MRAARVEVPRGEKEPPLKEEVEKREKGRRREKEKRPSNKSSSSSFALLVHDL